MSGQAIECPMESVDFTVVLHKDLELNMPRAKTWAGWITFGFHEDLNEAAATARREMIDLMQSMFGVNRSEATALASTVVDLRITQVVNGVKGVHAVLPHVSIR